MLYQITEETGILPKDLRWSLTASDLAEWAVYLNSPFSRRSREALMNGWLTHVIRSIVADKRRKPKFSDSMFPFDKVTKEFFAQAKPAKASGAAKGKAMTKDEALHLSQVLRQRFEKAMADYKAGRKPNRFGLYVGERLRK